MLEEGLRLQRLGSPDKAVALFQQVLRSDPASAEAHYCLAVSACQAGDFARGIEFARRAFALEQRHFKAANLLGKALQRIGRGAEAIEQFDRAISIAPGFAEAHGNRAALLMEIGALPDALEGFNRAVALNPHSISDWQDRGVLLFMLRRYEDAIESYDRVLAVNADAFESHVARAEALMALDRLDEAQAAVEAALRLRPSREALLVLARILMRAGRMSKALAALDLAPEADAWPPAMTLRGIILGHMGRHEDAWACFERCLRLEPNQVDALFNGANALYELGRSGEALTALDRAAALKPQDPMICSGRGNALAALRRHDEALSAYEGALALRPGDPAALYGRGTALTELGRPEEAVASFDAALAIRPVYAEALVNRGLAMVELRRHDDAFKDYEQALSIQPDLAKAHMNEAVLRLLLGDFRTGWEKYEWRWKSIGVKEREFPVAKWNGEALREGTTVLLHAEQGYGDTIQFARFIPLVSRLGVTVIFELHRELKPLYERMPGAMVIGGGETLPRFDLHCPLLSLPLTLGTTLDTIPPATPYVTAPVERLSRWRDRVPGGPRRKVGIAWSGNPKLLRDRQRSISLDSLSPVLELPGLSFVTLNPATAPEDEQKLARLGNVVHLAKDFSDFADTAAAMAQLDLIISVDTSIAHLAGALGKPVWILLPYVPDWRWMLDRGDSPWYPTARLFRQPKSGDWASVVATIRQELAGAHH
jgi:tetratricopeptide (TPR) repeat protein